MKFFKTPNISQKLKDFGLTNQAIGALEHIRVLNDVRGRMSKKNYPCWGDYGCHDGLTVCGEWDDRRLCWCCRRRRRWRWWSTPGGHEDGGVDVGHEGGRVDVERRHFRRHVVGWVSLVLPTVGHLAAFARHRVVVLKKRRRSGWVGSPAVRALPTDPCLEKRVCALHTRGAAWTTRPNPWQTPASITSMHNNWWGKKLLTANKS